MLTNQILSRCLRAWLHPTPLDGFSQRMKHVRTMVFFVALLLMIPASGLAKMYEEPISFSLQDKSLQRVDRRVMKAIDPKRLLEQDRQQGKDRVRPVPLRFAVTEDAALDLRNSGTWQRLPEGRLWRLRIRTQGAISHNLGITRFEMPEGAKLWIYDPDRKHVEGPYLRKNRSHAGSLWTPIIEGDEIVVELFVPNRAVQPNIVITKVNKGYRGFGKVGLLGGSEGACNIDVVCPEGTPPWANQIRAVTAYTIGGNSACTGTLMNNTNLDWRPFVLSANHCGVNATTDATIVAYWNFQAAACDTHGPGPTTDNQMGATFRATQAASDFVLFELDTAPSGFNVFYAGWDRSGISPAVGVSGIHHPRADVKAISIANTPPLSSGNFWQANWDVARPGNDVAITEPGSSGSCIFANDTQRCIGVLSNGPSACGVAPANLHDFYGMFSVAWTGGGTDATRLSNWLDPDSTGALALDGDPHITTLDGTRYDFQGAGEYVAVRTGTGTEVQVRQAPIATTFNPGADPYHGLATCVSLNSAVAARVGKHRVTYQPNLTGAPDPSGMQLRVDSKLTKLGANGIDLAGGGRIARTMAAGGIEIAFPEAYTLTVTPGWWASEGKWYLNVGMVRTGRSTGISGASPGAGIGGIAGVIPVGSWLPTLPDGSAMPPMPGTLDQRFIDLYHKFGEAWRVSDSSSLFDYAPGTSTDTFTMKSWPPKKPPCVLPQTIPVKPASLAVAQRACARVADRRTRANCVFDVQVTGELGFAKTYLASERVASGATTIRVEGYRGASTHGEPITLTATVAVRSPPAKRTPTGAVQFLVDGERAGDRIRLDARGRAEWKTTALKPGRHAIGAIYIPTANSAFSSATSTEALSVFVGK